MYARRIYAFRKYSGNFNVRDVHDVVKDNDDSPSTIVDRQRTKFLALFSCLGNARLGLGEGAHGARPMTIKDWLPYLYLLRVSWISLLVVIALVAAAFSRLSTVVGGAFDLTPPQV